MAPSFNLKILEQCQISPSPNPPPPPPPISLPLTIFDLPWLPFSPTQLLFFYNHPTSTSTTTFTSTTLPLLKHSLSLTLHHFHPLCAHLSTTPPPHLTYSPGDSIPFTVAESTADFSYLSGNHPRPAAYFHSLLPQIPSTTSSKNHTTFPLLLIQITHFPRMGLSIGVSFNHILGDERTFNHFMKSWAFICSSLKKKNPDPLMCFKPLLVFDRSVINNPNDLYATLIKQCRNWLNSPILSLTRNVKNMVRVRATFVVTLHDMENIKRWIINQCKKNDQSQPLVLSPYVLTCAFIWVCLIKAQFQESGSNSGKHPIYFGFNAGAMTRLNYPVPQGYFGNCVGFGRSAVAAADLAGGDGVVAAAEAIGRTIKELDGDILGCADKWVPEWEVFFGSGLHVVVVGSPKVDLYEMDFGWGRPIKIEEVSIDGLSNGISLNESRDLKGGIEVGVVLDEDLMDDFSCLFNGESEYHIDEPHKD
ncbi:hypothetical protein LguiA_019452 [Lonicera macranthoides]